MSNETLALFESAARIGLPVPDKLRDALARLHNRRKDVDETGNGLFPCSRTFFSGRLFL